MDHSEEHDHEHHVPIDARKIIPASTPTLPQPTSILSPYLHPSLSSLLIPLYPTLLPLQSHLLPLLLNPHVIHNPRDLTVTAETGSGKTLCFVLPIINSILKSSSPNGTKNSKVTKCPPSIQAVVILPTVNLASQVYSDFLAFTSKLGVSCSLDSVKERAMTQVVVATPGSIKRRFESGSDWVRGLRWIVVDEADRVGGQRMGWWEGFNVETNRKRKRIEGGEGGSLEQVLDSVCSPNGTISVSYNRDPMEPNYTPLRKMCFSATKQQDVMRRQVFGLNYPRQFDFRKERGVVERGLKALANDGVGGTVYKSNDDENDYGDDDMHYVSNNVAEEVCNVTPENKPEVTRVLSMGQPCTLVFCNSTDSAHRLTRYLQGSGVEAKELTGKVSKGGRKKVIEWRGRRRVIVATDSASRGMNLDVDLVVNYDLPTSLSQYVHRAGRTGRGFGTGTVISLRKQGEAWSKFEKELGRVGRIKVREVEGGVDRGKLGVLKDIMNMEEEGELGYEEEYKRGGNGDEDDSSSVPSSSDDEDDDDDDEEDEAE